MENVFKVKSEKGNYLYITPGGSFTWIKDELNGSDFNEKDAKKFAKKHKGIVI